MLIENFILIFINKKFLKTPIFTFAGKLRILWYEEFFAESSDGAQTPHDNSAQIPHDGVYGKQEINRPECLY